MIADFHWKYPSVIEYVCQRRWLDSHTISPPVCYLSTSVDHCPQVPNKQNWSARKVSHPYSPFTFFSLQLYSQSHVSANACIFASYVAARLEASVRLRIKVIGLAPSFSLVQRPMSKCSKESGFLFSPIVILGEQSNQISFSC